MANGLGQVISWYICTIAAVLFLAARLWARVHRLGALGPDDDLIILATCCLIADLAIQHYMWNLGMAEIPQVSRENLTRMMVMIVPGSILYVSSLWAIKIAMVLFYKSLVAPGMRLQLTYNITLTLLVIFWGVIFFNIIFQCFPHDKRWSQDPTYECDPRNGEINYWLTVLLNVVTDDAIISLPISMVLKFQMKLKQKLGVIAIFTLGFFVVIASIIRAHYAKRNETMLTCTVSTIETAVAIVAACLPPLRILFQGPASSAGTKSTHGHCKLSSVGHNRSRRTHPSHITTDLVGGAPNKGISSEYELVVSEGAGRMDDKNGGITVSTTFQVHHGMDHETRGPQARHNIFD